MLLKLPVCTQVNSKMIFGPDTYSTSHKKVSRVTQYVTLLNDCLFSTYNSITCVLRTFNVKRMRTTRYGYGTAYSTYVSMGTQRCKLSVQREGRGATA